MYTFIETKIFTRIVGDYLSDDSYKALQLDLSNNPDQGAIIKGSGGVRKVRWNVPGAGKVVVYELSIMLGQSKEKFGCLRSTKKMKQNQYRHMFYVLYARRLKMNKEKRDIGTEILEGLQELKRGEHGRISTIPSIHEIRDKVGLSQSDFAKLLGVSVRTLQDWEQGRRKPSGAARTLLTIAATNPKAILDVA